jgi:hypothetical protein
MLCNDTRWWQTKDVLAERLDKKLQEWSPETAEQVRFEVVELIDSTRSGNQAVSAVAGRFCTGKEWLHDGLHPSRRYPTADRGNYQPECGRA